MENEMQRISDGESQIKIITDKKKYFYYFQQ